MGWGFGNLGGGSGDRWNVFTKTSEPPEGDGLWIKRNDVSKVEFSELVVGDGELVTKNAVVPIRQSRGAAPISYDDKIYVLGGASSSGGSYTEDYVGVYDPESDTYTYENGALFLPSHSMATVRVGNIAYYIGGIGSESGSGATMTHYDGNRNLSKYDLSTGITGSTITHFLSTNKQGAGAAVEVDGVIYHFGGSRHYSSITSVSNTDEGVVTSYDIESGSTVADLGIRIRPSSNVGLNDCFAYVINNIVYIHGGEGTSTTTSGVFRFDPSTSTWTKTHSGAVPNHSIYSSAVVVGGIAYINWSSGFYMYDPITDTRTDRLSLTDVDMRMGGIVEHNGSIYTFGGYSTTALRYQQINQYKIATNEYQPGTAIAKLNLDSSGVVLYQDNKISMRAGVDRVLYQTADGLIAAEAATNSNGAGWTDI